MVLKDNVEPHNVTILLLLTGTIDSAWFLFSLPEPLLLSLYVKHPVAARQGNFLWKSEGKQRGCGCSRAVSLGWKRGQINDQKVKVDINIADSTDNEEGGLCGGRMTTQQGAGVWVGVRQCVMTTYSHCWAPWAKSGPDGDWAGCSSQRREASMCVICAQAVQMLHSSFWSQCLYDSNVDDCSQEGTLINLAGPWQSKSGWS